MAYFPSDKYTFDCKYVSFCIELNTFIRLKIANSFLFLIFPVCYLYVMSQSTFHDQIRPRPLIACLNCAAWSLSGQRLFSVELYMHKVCVQAATQNILAPFKIASVAPAGSSYFQKIIDERVLITCFFHSVDYDTDTPLGCLFRPKGSIAPRRKGVSVFKQVGNK